MLASEGGVVVAVRTRRGARIRGPRDGAPVRVAVVARVLAGGGLLVEGTRWPGAAPAGARPGDLVAARGVLAGGAVTWVAVTVLGAARRGEVTIPGVLAGPVATYQMGGSCSIRALAAWVEAEGHSLVTEST